MSKRPKIRIADAALEVMREQGETRIWLGNVNLWEDVYMRAYGGDTEAGVRSRNPHPMNRCQAVFDALRRSKTFERTGYIRSIGWSDRETLHPLYRIRDSDSDPKGENAAGG